MAQPTPPRIDLRAAEVTELLGGRVKILRHPRIYPPAVDALLLAASVEATEVTDVLDVGIGGGAATLALLARARNSRVWGIDTNAEALEIARQSAALCGWSRQLTTIEGSIADASALLSGRQFDIVMTNPPFYPSETIRRSPFEPRGSAHEESLPLQDWLTCALKRVRSGGWFHIIHRPDRIEEIITATAGHLGDLRILPIFPKADIAPATRVILAGRKGSKAPARILQGLVLHENDGSYTKAADRVLRDADAVSLA